MCVLERRRRHARARVSASPAAVPLTVTCVSSDRCLRRGRDVQLETAVRVALEAIQKREREAAERQLANLQLGPEATVVPMPRARAHWSRQ